MRSRWTLAAALLVFGVVATACPADTNGGTGAQGSDVLSDVIDRGTLNCGVNDAVPGFGIVDEGGNFSGFDVDFCRAVAAAVLGDAEAVALTSLTAEQRFTALQGGEVDVLIRNTTWTSSRDGGEGAAFATTTFYDGQGMMVKTASGVDAIEDLDGATICVLSGTTTELNLATQFEARGLDFTPLSLTEPPQIQENFIADRCTGWTADKSQLAGLRSNWPADQGGPETLRVLDETMSKEPLGPAVRDGDPDWFDAVNWTVIATILAEELGITSENVDEIRETTTDAEIQRLLGVPIPPAEGEEGEAEPFDPGLGLPIDFAYQIVKQVGNYGEIYERNVGAGTPLGLERGVNALWTEGGLLYGPPNR